jgi:hypothetical protein
MGVKKMGVDFWDRTKVTKIGDSITLLNNLHADNNFLVLVLY